MDKKDAGMEKKDRKKLLLIIMHIVIISGLAVLIVFLALPSDDGQKDIAITEQITEEPQPLAGNTANTQTPVPTATATTVGPSQTADTGASPSPTTSTTATPAPTTTGTPRPTTVTTPRPTTAPKPTTTTAPTPTPTTTTAPTPTPTTTTAPTPTPTQTVEPTPTPEFTYSVTNKDGVAPAGYTFVFVTVTPDGSYTVKYSGTTMEKSSGKYYLMVEKLESGNYRSNVSVTKN